MNTIWRSRKFWLMIADTGVSLITYFVGKYLSPDAAKDILFLIGALQPVWLMVIGFIGLQNVAGIKASASQNVG